MKYKLRQGFTLIELLVVIAIIAILAAILFPVFARAREKARSIACLSNNKQIATALMMYCQDNDGAEPDGPRTGRELGLPTVGAVGRYGNGGAAGERRGGQSARRPRFGHCVRGLPYVRRGA